jgi:hypothetical protein
MNDRRQPERSQGELARFAAIAQVAVAKGWGHYAERLGLRPEKDGGPGLDGRKTEAVRLREALEELGPTFVKFGQMLSQREELLPAGLVAELRQLQDRVGRFPAADARRIIEEDTGKSVGELFATFDDEPMAAASMAQVSAASRSSTSGTTAAARSSAICCTPATALHSPSSWPPSWWARRSCSRHMRARIGRACRCSESSASWSPACSVSPGRCWH